MKASNPTLRYSLTELQVIGATANVTLSHSDVSERVTEGHYKVMKMDDHKRLELQILYNPIIVQSLT